MNRLQTCAALAMVSALVLPAAAVAAPVSARTSVGGSFVAAEWYRCSQPTVGVEPVFGKVLKTRRISCRRATDELSAMYVNRSGLHPTEGNNWFWSCRQTGSHLDGGYYKCKHGKKSFRASVGS